MGKILLLVLLLGLLGFSAQAQQKVQTKVTIDFLYPGGEASPTEAVPVLEFFFEQLTKLTGYQISGVYRNDPQQIRNTLKTKKAELLFVSLDLLDESREGYEILVHTLSLATKKATQQFHFVTHKLAQAPFRQIIMERELEPHFLSKNILTPCQLGDQPDLIVSADKQILARIKNISTSLAPLILLNDFQYYSLKNLNTDWARQLKLVCSTPDLPSDPVLVRKELALEIRQNLEKALMAMGDSTAGQEILNALRLVGFKQP